MSLQHEEITYSWKAEIIVNKQRLELLISDFPTFTGLLNSIIPLPEKVLIEKLGD